MNCFTHICRKWLCSGEWLGSFEFQCSTAESCVLHMVIVPNMEHHTNVNVMPGSNKTRWKRTKKKQFWRAEKTKFDCLDVHGPFAILIVSKYSSKVEIKFLRNIFDGCQWGRMKALRWEWFWLWEKVERVISPEEDVFLSVFLLTFLLRSTCTWIVSSNMHTQVPFRPCASTYAE